MNSFAPSMMLHKTDFLHRCQFITGGNSDMEFQSLNESLTEWEIQNGRPVNRIFYLAIPPTAFVPVTKLIRKHVMTMV
jgi:glucose-6-phosphate 1-dehydrogenase